MALFKLKNLLREAVRKPHRVITLKNVFKMVTNLQNGNLNISQVEVYDFPLRYSFSRCQGYFETFYENSDSIERQVFSSLIA